MDFINIAKNVTRYAVTLTRKLSRKSWSRFWKPLMWLRLRRTSSRFICLSFRVRRALPKSARQRASTVRPWQSSCAPITTTAWTRPFDKKQSGDIDASILTDHMMLQATELGLGTVWVCYFDPAVLRKEFDLPANLEPVNILVIGYSNEGTGDPNRFNKQRIPMSQLVSYETL